MLKFFGNLCGSKEVNQARQYKKATPQEVRQRDATIARLAYPNGKKPPRKKAKSDEVEVVASTSAKLGVSKK